MGLSWQPVCPPTRVLRPSVDTPESSGQDFVSDRTARLGSFLWPAQADGPGPTVRAGSALSAS